MRTVRPTYSSARFRAYRGDARDVVPLLGRVDLVLTDPPYASGARRDAERTARGKTMIRSVGSTAGWFAADSMTGAGYGYLISSTFFAVRDRLPEGVPVFAFADRRQAAELRALLESVGVRVHQELTWDKTYFGMGAYFRNQDERIVFASVGRARAIARRDVGTVIRCKPVSPAARSHPTEKPVELMKLLIGLYTEPGDVVLDPFCGTGATADAAVELGRRAVVCDVNPGYLAKAVDRVRAAEAAHPPGRRVKKLRRG